MDHCANAGEVGKGAQSVSFSKVEKLQALHEKAARLFDPDTSGPADPGATYAYCWRECGGAQSLEELERLSNECARVCNQRRTRLQEGAREKVDRAIAELAPIFDVQACMTTYP